MSDFCRFCERQCIIMTSAILIRDGGQRIQDDGVKHQRRAKSGPLALIGVNLVERADCPPTITQIGQARMRMEAINRVSEASKPHDASNFSLYFFKSHGHLCMAVPPVAPKGTSLTCPLYRSVPCEPVFYIDSEGLIRKKVPSRG